MRDPYEVLGVPRNASLEQVKDAYRALAKKYHPDNFNGNLLEEDATRKMQEINEAYDAIISGRASSYSSGGYTYNSDPYQSVLDSITHSRLDEAEGTLESMPPNQRNARWYYLKGQINYQRGWTDQAYTYFNTAHNMEPGNPEYTHAYENLNRQRNGGYRTNGRTVHNSSNGDCCDCGGCDGCDICSSILCADCCCECMGGDLISCC